MFLLLVMALIGQKAGAQTPVVNGRLQTGEISPAGDADSWSFSAAPGSGVMIRVGATNFTPRIRVFAPDNTQVAETTSGNSFVRDGFLSLQATNGGTYSVLVSATIASQTGTYGMTVAQAPDAFEVTPGDDGGVLINGALHAGTIWLGDLDMWSFDAVAGGSATLRIGSPTVTPWLRVYGPDGALAVETTSGNSFTRDGWVTVPELKTGQYTVVVSATVQGQSGNYSLTLAQAPGPFTVSEGDQGGALANGASQPGTITVGDLDLWSLSAKAGDSLVLRMGSPDLTPWLRVYAPNGILAAETTSGNSFARDGSVSLTATNGGTFTVVVAATVAGQTGAYTLSLAQAPGSITISPGDQGGPMTNGIAHTGTITTGDLDLWSFAADAGDSFVLRMGSPELTPWIRVYGPTGTLVGETKSGNTFTRDGWVTGRATESGSYTVAVSATGAGQAGAYTLALAQAPKPIELLSGEEGGALTNGWRHTAKLDLGDIDVWSFVGTPGDSNVLRVVATNFTPWIRLYGPDGALVKETTSGNSFTREGFVNLNITNSGTYTLVVSATVAGQSGSYGLKESRVPPDLNMPETQHIEEGSSLNVSISAQDPDEPSKPLVFNLLSGPAGLTLKTAGITNATLTWTTAEVDGPSTNVVVATVTDTVGGKAFTRTNSFIVIVDEINVPPNLTVPNNQTLDELTGLQVQASAVDVDLPANPLTYSLISPPVGMVIDPATGAIAWSPTEAQGPSGQVVSVVVTDSSPSAANAVQFSVTNAFTVAVREVNLRPALTVPSDQRIDELTTLNLAATASDPDLPSNTLAFSLVAAPAGMTIHPTSGAITWAPTEAQGPSTNGVTVQVEDNGSPALTATGSFTVIVNDVNTPPVLPAQTDLTVDELVPVVVHGTATDSDLPANALTYELVSAPANATLSADGTINWTPTEAQGPSTNTFTLVVSDHGSPSLGATNTFTVRVQEVNVVPSLQPIAGQSLPYGLPLTAQASASDEDLPANALTYSLDQPPTNMTIDPTSGLIQWTPGQSQVGAHTVTVRVTDNGSPSRSATIAFTVNVTGEGSTLAIGRLEGGLMQITINGSLTQDYELQKSLDLVQWETLVKQRQSTYIDPDSKTDQVRFYRVRFGPQ